MPRHHCMLTQFVVVWYDMVCRIMRNLSLPVVWEDVDVPEEWERDASSIPDKYSKGRYVFWAWTHQTTEQAVLPFNSTAVPMLLDLGTLDTSEFANASSSWNSTIKAPGSMGVLFRDPSTINLTLQGNNPFQDHLLEAGVQPTDQWPAMLYGTLPKAWGIKQPDTDNVTFPNLEVMCVPAYRALNINSGLYACYSAMFLKKCMSCCNCVSITAFMCSK